MVMKIINPALIRKIRMLARASGLSEEAAVAQAIDRMLAERISRDGPADPISALLRKIDRIAERKGAVDPLGWDAHGLPR